MNNAELNLWIMDHCDDEAHAVAGGKAIPYIGWFWRDVDFEYGEIIVGNCGSFIGFMQDNKWDYPSACLTEAQRAVVLDILGEAIRNPTRKWELLKSLWEYMQTIECVG